MDTAYLDRRAREWLRENGPGGMSAAQVARHLLIQVSGIEGSFRDCIWWNLQPPGEQVSRTRSLFPLPLWHDCRLAMQRVLEDGRVRDDPGEWRERADTRGKAGKRLHYEGLLLWHGMVVSALNHMEGSWQRQERPLRGGLASAAQEEALCRLWRTVEVFVGEKGERGVPRAWSGDWGSKIDDLRVSYTGETIERAYEITLEQVLPALPKPEHGGMVELVEVLPADMVKVVSHPEKLIMEEPQGLPPRPRVRCSDEEWPQVVQALLDRGIATLVTHTPVYQGMRMANGAFGVPKPEKFTESGLPVLRFIMDLRATNYFMTQIPGDTKTLTGAASFQRIVVQEHEELLVSGEDLTAAFYLFRLPPAWAEYMVLEKKVCLRDLGHDSDECRYVGITVLPMGWSSAVGLMQAAHRRIALRSVSCGGAGLSGLAEISRDMDFPSLEDEPGWSIYLDDTTIIEKVEQAVAEELEGKLPEEQARLRGAYAWWGIPTNAGKAMQRVKEADRLGALLDGGRGVLRTRTQRSLDLIGLGTFVRGMSSTSIKALQVWAGKAVHILQFRRCLFSNLEVIFAKIAAGRKSQNMDYKLAQEMLLVEALLPVVQCNLRAQVDPVVTCSDASESGGGMCFSSRLTWAGREEAERLLAGEQGDPVRDETSLPPEEVVLVIDLFAGIGGLTEAVRRAGVHRHYSVFVEQDKHCRRLLRRRHPGAELHPDVKSFGVKEIEAALDRCGRAVGVIVGGGSPCQGLSRLSTLREHLEDPRSRLFHEAVRIFREVEAVAASRDLWHLKILENVVADAEDISEMSYHLGMRAVMVESGSISRVKRPRLYWMSVPPAEDPEAVRKELDRFDHLALSAPLEPLTCFLGEETFWEAGSEDPQLRLPTFTRAIPRRKPPPDPAGLRGSSPGALERWRCDGYRYPPYTYGRKYMVVDPGGDPRPLNAEEREILMGYDRGHTLAMLKKSPETSEDRREAEDIRCAAIGNAFHVNTVAYLIDGALVSLGLKRARGAREICLAHVNRQQGTVAVKLEEEDEDDLPVAWLPEELGQDRLDEQSDDELSRAGLATLDELEEDALYVPHVEQMKEYDLMLSSRIVSAFIRRQEFRGSDVRLDLGSLYRPDSFPRGSISPKRWRWHVGQSYAFHSEEHINVLEMRALVNALEWRLRSPAFGSCRALHLVDSQVVLAVAVKGRSSSRILNRLLRKYAALQVAGGVIPILGWVESEDNPADAPSRAHAQEN